jgi:bacterioferritin-associated ferredoxin
MRLICRSSGLYLCLCRAISDRDVAAFARAGACTVGQVFKAKGCKPNCGSCIGHIRGTLDEVLAEGCPAEMAAAD